MLQRGHSGDGCDLASTFCKYDLRKFNCSELGKGVTSEARSISSELLMCGGVSCYFLLWLDA